MKHPTSPLARRLLLSAVVFGGAGGAWMTQAHADATARAATQAANRRLAVAVLQARCLNATEAQRFAIALRGFRTPVPAGVGRP